MSNTKKNKMSSRQLAAVARLFAVLSEPSRLALLQALHAGPLSVGQLVADCSMKQANVSKHLADVVFSELFTVASFMDDTASCGRLR